jgi:hypothetical protein
MKKLKRIRDDSERYEDFNHRKKNIVYKNWKKEERTDPQGRPIVTYTWVDDPNVQDVPDNFRYVDVDGNFIQLWVDNGNHGWQFAKPGPTKEGYEDNKDRPDCPPPSFANVDDTAAALNKVGYKEFNADPLHHGRQFFLPTSPTFHVTVSGKVEVGQIFTASPGATVITVRGSGPISSVDFHNESHTQAGSWGDMFRHIWDAARGKQ